MLFLIGEVESREYIVTGLFLRPFLWLGNELIIKEKKKLLRKHKKKGKSNSLFQFFIESNL